MPPKHSTNKKKADQLAVEIRKIRKHPTNLICCDCQARTTPYVCLDFSSFICTSCSGIHREFNHRVKSIAMATFTEAEVARIKESGNEFINRHYLAKYRKGRDTYTLPREGETEKIKQFIQLKYKQKKWYKENPKELKKKKKKKKKSKKNKQRHYSDDDEEYEKPAPKKKNTNFQPEPQPVQVQRKPSPQVQPKPKPPQAEPIDLLFGATAAAPATNNNNQASNGFDDPAGAWANFDSPTNAQVQAQPPAQTEWDPWAGPPANTNPVVNTTTSQSNPMGGWTDEIFGDSLNAKPAAAPVVVAPMKPKPVAKNVTNTILSGYVKQRNSLVQLQQQRNSLVGLPMNMMGQPVPQAIPNGMWGQPAPPQQVRQPIQQQQAMMGQPMMGQQVAQPGNPLFSAISQSNLQKQAEQQQAEQNAKNIAQNISKQQQANADPFATLMGGFDGIKPNETISTSTTTTTTTSSTNTMNSSFVQPPNQNRMQQGSPMQPMTMPMQPPNQYMPAQYVNPMMNANPYMNAANPYMQNSPQTGGGVVGGFNPFR